MNTTKLASPAAIAQISIDMLARLNIASWGLLVGAIGQSLLWSAWATGRPSAIIWIATLPPWLTVFTITFCRQPPCGPRRFRHCLLFAMGWYAVMTLAAETLGALTRPTRDGIIPIVGRVLTYVGALSFIVFIRACGELRRYETTKIPPEELGKS